MKTLKNIISKLKKQYTVVLRDVLQMDQKSTKYVRKQIDYTLTYWAPGASFRPNTKIQIPLDAINVAYKKDLKAVYVIDEIDHKTRRIYASIKSLIPNITYSYTSSFPFNTEIQYQSPQVSMKLKILLRKRSSKGILCSQKIQKEIKSKVLKIISGHESLEPVRNNFAQALESILNKSIIKIIYNEALEYTDFIKNIAFIRIQRL
jgi:hypothetical protein